MVGIRKEDTMIDDVRALHPFCNTCGWRKGGVDSWNGAVCKCGHQEPPIKTIEDIVEQVRK